MSYTPKFAASLKKIEEATQLGASDGEVQNLFQTEMQALGPYERLNNLYRIRPKRPIPGEPSRMQFFRMNKMQDHYWHNRTNRDLILKMRQGGVTTFSCLVGLDKALWEPGTHSAIMAHVRDNVKKFFRISKTAFLQFQKDWGMFYPVTNTRDNVSELGIKETGSELIVCTESKGLTLDFLHISEAAFVEESRISESVESVPLSCQIIMETTPNVASGMFYDLWDGYYKDPEQALYKAHFYPWWWQYPEEEDIPHLVPSSNFKLTDKEKVLSETHDLTTAQILWRRLKISESGGDEGEFLRKYPEDPMTCFLSGSNSVFSAETLAALWKNERIPAFIGDIALL